MQSAQCVSLFVFWSTWCNQVIREMAFLLFRPSILRRLSAYESLVPLPSPKTERIATIAVAMRTVTQAVCNPSALVDSARSATALDSQVS